MTPRQIIEQTLKHEGGYVNHPRDRGGATNHGITIGWYREHVNPEATVEDIKALTRETAYDLYYEHIFTRYRVQELPAVVQDVYFDMIVNHGARRAAILLQRGIKRSKVAIVVDGMVGSKTRAAAVEANQRDPQQLRDNVLDAREDFFEDIVEARPDQHVFFDGWIANRVEAFRFT